MQIKYNGVIDAKVTIFVYDERAKYYTKVKATAVLQCKKCMHNRLCSTHFSNRRCHFSTNGGHYFLKLICKLNPEISLPVY